MQAAHARMQAHVRGTAAAARSPSHAPPPTRVEHGEAAAADGGHAGGAVALGDGALHSDRVGEGGLVGDHRRQGPLCSKPRWAAGGAGWGREASPGTTASVWGGKRPAQAVEAAAGALEAVAPGQPASPCGPAGNDPRSQPGTTTQCTAHHHTTTHPPTTHPPARPLVRLHGPRHCAPPHHTHTHPHASPPPTHAPARLPWPTSRRPGGPTRPVSPTEEGGKEY